MLVDVADHEVLEEPAEDGLVYRHAASGGVKV
jgi:hypothetical protein